jgi:hypothetical protein
MTSQYSYGWRHKDFSKRENVNCVVSVSIIFTVYNWPVIQSVAKQPSDKLNTDPNSEPLKIRSASKSDKQSVNRYNRQTQGPPTHPRFMKEIN